MKNKSKIILSAVWVCSIISAILFGCILSGFFVISDIKTNETAFGNWAMWVGGIGGVIAAGGAIFAANFTRKTFRFLLRQHADNLEMQNMQMYLEHKNAFFSLLAQLETSHSNKFIFKDKETLYQELFPNNNFFTFSAKAPIKSTNDEKHKLLSSICKTYDEYGNNEPKVEYCLKNSHFIHSIKFLLHIQVVDKNTLGDNHNTLPGYQELKWNIFEIDLLLQFIHNATAQCFKFTGNNPPEPTKWKPHPQPTLIINELISNEQNARDPIHDQGLNLNSDRFNTITLLAKFMRLNQSGRVGHLVNNQFIYVALHHLFKSDVNRFEALLQDLNEQYRLLYQAQAWLIQADEEGGNNWENPLKLEVRKLVTQISQCLVNITKEIQAQQ